MKREEIQKQLISQKNAAWDSLKESIVNSVTEPPPQERFSSIEQLKEKAALEADREIALFEGMVDKGMKAIVEVLESQQAEGREAMSDWFEKEGEKLLEIAKLDKVQAFSEKGTLQNLLHFPDQFLLLMHSATLQLLNDKRHEEALAAILICLFINSLVDEFWFTYGRILTESGHLENALYAFQMSIVLNEKNPYPHAHMAHVWIQLNSMPYAQESLQEAVKLSRENSVVYRELLDYCDSLSAYIAQCQQQQKVA